MRGHYGKKSKVYKEGIKDLTKVFSTYGLAAAGAVGGTAGAVYLLNKHREKKAGMLKEALHPDTIKQNKRKVNWFNRKRVRGYSTGSLTPELATDLITSRLRGRGMGRSQARSLAQAGVDLAFEQGGMPKVKKHMRTVHVLTKDTKPTQFAGSKCMKSYQFHSGLQDAIKAVEKGRTSMPSRLTTGRKLMAGASLLAAGGAVYYAVNKTKKDRENLQHQQAIRQAASQQRQRQYQAARQAYIRKRMTEEEQLPERQYRNQIRYYN